MQEAVKLNILIKTDQTNSIDQLQGFICPNCYTDTVCGLPKSTSCMFGVMEVEERSKPISNDNFMLVGCHLLMADGRFTAEAVALLEAQGK